MYGRVDRFPIMYKSPNIIGHCGKERADQLAREAVNNSAIIINSPPSWAAYKPRTTNSNISRMGVHMEL